LLSKKQTDFLFKSTASFDICSGAVASGKTYVSNLRFYNHIYDCPDDCLLLLTGKTSESLHDNVILDLLKFDAIKDFEFHRMPSRIFVKSKGIEIACVGAYNEKSHDRIRGKTVAGWLADEVTTYPENFVKMAQSRVRHSGKTWPKIWTCNPEHPEHFILKDYIQNPDLDVKTWWFEIDDNPVLTTEYIDELKNSYSGVYYDRMILGKWVLAEGSVYEEFRRDVHVVDNFKIPFNWPRIRGIDYGYTNPFCCLWGAIDPDGRLYIYAEHYKSKMLLKQHAEIIKLRDLEVYNGKEYDVRYSFTVSDHDAQDNAEMASLGIATHNAQKDVITGIQKVKNRLKVQGDGRPRLYITKACPNTIKEFFTYRWNEKKPGKNEKEEPIKDLDHAMDDLRYMIMELDYSSRPKVTGKFPF